MSVGIIIAVVVFFIAIGIAAAIAFSGSTGENNTKKTSIGLVEKIQVSVSGDWQQYETSIRQACQEVSSLFNDNIQLPVLFSATTGSNGSIIAAAAMSDSSKIHGGGIILIYTDYLGTPSSGYKEVLVHELLHVMGIGSHNIWSGAVLAGNLLDGSDFPNALEEYQDLGGVGTDIPLGTKNGHWRESTFGDEIMTPYVNSAIDLKLSKLTGAALKDMGWDIILTIPPFEDYTLP